MSKFTLFVHKKRDCLVFWVCIFAAVAAFFANSARSEEVSKVCNSNKAEIRKMEKDFTKVIFNTWRKANNKGDPQLLWQKAQFTAFWILRDNNISCR